ncbi:MAG: hypothetical protein QNJ91_07160 [Gammaproteobacteria bacterium]|nr:hypothetical protein [Gammaproteobacteria bacterium]
MNAAADAPRHYAVRRVNPFDGVLQVVETHNGRAYSPDGRVWQVQVLTQRPDHTWHSFNHVAPIEQFFNFGLWDADDGLRKVPANPVMDIGGMRDAADVLIAALRQLDAELPFPLIDVHECWSTDYAGDPVALLATTEDPALIGDMRVGRWHATRLADHSFEAPSLSRRGVAMRSELGPRQHAERLERQVRQLGQHKAWFRRRRDGSGERVGSPAGPQTLDAARFPPLGLKSDWHRDDEAELAHDYLAWLAPRLLTLQHIDDAQRHWLEAAACRQAVELAAGYRLIPRVLDRDAIEAARVEAKLRRASR